MRRREFIKLVGGAAAAWPLSVNAQPSAKIPRIGLMVTGSLQSPEARVQLDAFRQGLRQLGYTEGRNIAIEYRGADARIERFPNLAAELVRLEVDLIFAANTPAALAARQATTTIPIVAAVMGDPVEDGLVASLAQPGGNVTGLTFLAPELTAKRMQLLKDALPNVSRVAALWHPGAYGERTMDDMLKATEAAARALGVHLQLIEVRAAEELERAFSTMMKERAEALFLFPSPMLFLARDDASSSLPQRTDCPPCPRRASLSSSAVSSPMARTSTTCFGAARCMWIRSSRAPSLPTSPSSNPLDSSWSSISKPPRRSASTCRWPS